MTTFSSSFVLSFPGLGSSGLNSTSDPIGASVGNRGTFGNSTFVMPIYYPLSKAVSPPESDPILSSR